MLLDLRRRNRDDMNVNLTPLIDVILTLIIFFMLSSRFDRSTQIAVNLPKAQGQPEQSQPVDVIDIGIDVNGQYYLNAQPLVNNQAQTLKLALEKTAAGNTDTPLVISADGKAPYQSVATAMDVAGQLGFHKLTMAAQKSAEEE